jgi:hypothetical protein
MAQGAERELRSKEHVISELDTLQNAARKKGISSEPNTSCSRKEAEGFFHLCVSLSTAQQACPRHPYTPLPPTPPTPRERWWIKTIIFVLSSPPSSFLGSGGGERTKV